MMSQRAYLRDGKKEQLWRDVVRRHATSGLGVREFCRLEHVSEASFYAWRRTLAQRDREATKKKRIQKKAATAKHSKKNPRRRSPSLPGNGRGRFVPLAVVREGGVVAGQCLEIVAPGGWRVRLPRGFDVEELAQVLKVLSTATVSNHGENV